MHKYLKNFSFIKYLIQSIDYRDVFGSLYSLLNNIRINKNKKNFLSCVLPIINVLTFTFIKYKKLKKDHNFFIRKLLQLGNDETPIDQTVSVYLKELLFIINKTNIFENLVIYNNDRSIIKSFLDDKCGGYVYLSFKYKDSLMVLYFLKSTTIGRFPIVINSNINDSAIVDDIRYDIHAEYYKDFIYKNKVSYYNTITGSIDKFEIKDMGYVKNSIYHELKNDITKSIDKHIKRSYAIIGDPGTGKSHLIMNLIKELNLNTIYVKINSDKEEDIDYLFYILNLMRDTIIVFEDIDGSGLKSKNIFSNMFLENLDNLKNENNNIIIATLNNSKGVHHTIINRRGRFDRVFLLDTLKTRSEILELLNIKYKDIANSDIDYNKISKKHLDLIIKHKFVQSDISEIASNILIYNDYNLSKFIKDLLKTKSNIAKNK